MGQDPSNNPIIQYVPYFLAVLFIVVGIAVLRNWIDSRSGVETRQFKPTDVLQRRAGKLGVLQDSLSSE